MGNGPSLNDIPLWFLQLYPTFGCNLIHLGKDGKMRTDGFKPTYYVAVDSWIFRDFGEGVLAAFADVPKFIPWPNLDWVEGPNFYRFYHRAGPLWPYCDEPLWPRDVLSEPGITYKGVTHISVQLAYFMGFTTILLVGMDNTHGRDEGSTRAPWKHYYAEPQRLKYGEPDHWEEAFKILADGFAETGVRMINLSTYTTMTKIERDDWRNWA